jgi:xanthine dehydrogenase small subunit
VSTRRTIRFLLDGNLHEIEDCDPSRTVLQFLREDLRRTGTKEGCAEGDCGACTVVVGEADASGMQLRAINSCIQFLPVLDGKELITVESLRDGDTLHAVQRAMIECHGSQCGFCTPGIVMSLFALYKNQNGATRREIDDALAGNLCRCTGYQPIVDAAARMYAADTQRAGDAWIDRPGRAGPGDDIAAKVDTLRALRESEALALDHAGRRFFAPDNLKDCASLIREHPEAVILAGGTDIGLWVTKQLRELDCVIYVGKVEELAKVRVIAAQIEIGAAVTLTDAMQAIVAHYPALDELFLRFASPPIRNAATLGGNIANGSPIGDTMPALMALRSSLILRRGDATRRLPLDEFFIDYQKTALRPGEFIERILLPLPGKDDVVASYKVSKRFDQDISAVCAAYWLSLANGKVTDVRVVYGGMAAVPKRAAGCEQVLRDAKWNEATVFKAMQALADDFAPISDMRASADYRREVCANLLYRFFLEQSETGQSGIYRYGR